MPQMMPINWMFYYMFFIVIFIMFNIMNYYIYYNFNFKKKNIFMKKKFFLNWKW